MADNTILSGISSTGDLMRTVHKTTAKVPTSLIDVGGTSTGVEAIIGDSTHAMPVVIRAGTTTQPVSQSGTWSLTTASTIHAIVSGSTISVSPLTTASTIHVAPLTTASTISVTGSVNISGSTYSAVDSAAFTAGTGQGVPIMGYAGTTAITTGDIGVVGMTTNRSIKATLYDSTGGELVYVSTLSVSNNSTFAVQVTDFSTTIQVYIYGSHEDDAIFTPTTSQGVAMMAVATDDTVSTGDVGALSMSLNRILKVAVYNSTGVEQSIGGGTQYTIGTTGSTGNTVTVAGVYRKDTPATLADTTGDVTGLEVDSEGKLWVNTSRSTQPVTATTASTIHAAQSGTWNAGTLALTNGGCSPYSFIGTTAYQSTTIKATSGQLYGLSAFNWSFTKCFLKIYDTSAAPSTADTAVHRVLIPASTVNGGAGVVHQTFPGIACSNGIGYKLTGAIADGDTSVAWSTASEGCINLLYK